MSKTLFEKIVAREIPAQIVFEDELVLAFRDINPRDCSIALGNRNPSVVIKSTLG